MNSTTTRSGLGKLGEFPEDDERAVAELLGDVEVWTIADGPEGWILWESIAVRRRWNRIEVHTNSTFGAVGDVVATAEVGDFEKDHHQMLMDFLMEIQSELEG